MTPGSVSVVGVANLFLKESEITLISLEIPYS